MLEMFTLKTHGPNVEFRSSCESPHRRSNVGLLEVTPWVFVGLCVWFCLFWCGVFVLFCFVCLCVGVVVFVWFACCVQRCQRSRMRVLLVWPACSLHVVCDGPSQPVRCWLWSSCHCCPKCMGWWHLGQVGWAPCAMRASHSCRSFWWWYPYPRWVVVPLAAFTMRLCSAQYRSFGWMSFGHRENAQTLRLMVCVTCLVCVGASCGVRTRYYSLEGWCDSGFTNDAWRAVQLAVLESCLEYSRPMCASVAIRRPRELFPLLGGSAVADYELCLGITGIL